MADSQHLLIAVLKAKQNDMNRECQQFQQRIKQITAQIMQSNNSADHDRLRQQINRICNDYSSSINRLEFRCFDECERSYDLIVYPVHSDEE